MVSPAQSRRTPATPSSARTHARATTATAGTKSQALATGHQPRCRHCHRQAKEGRAREKTRAGTTQTQKTDRTKRKGRKDKERKEQEAKRAAQDERKLQAMRDENLRRMAGMAGATGSPNATGDALRASGPSPSYGGRISARVKPNIVFNPDDVSGNPVAEVEVRTAPDGKIMSRKLIKSSGNKAWDEAVIKALDKTDTLPRDTDGTIPTMMVLGFKPRD